MMMETIPAGICRNRPYAPARDQETLRRDASELLRSRLADGFDRFSAAKLEPASPDAIAGPADILGP
ncbi:MAG: hypothetical protein MI861_26045 [Pirellulales bacterium]|nr:hypothetical protein [Pirellulales bacterium]